MILRAGLVHPSSQWEQVFRQEGFPLGIVDLNNFKATDWSFLIVNRPLKGGEADIASSYLKEGGAIFSFMGFGREVLGATGYHAKIGYVTSRKGELFEEIGLLDVGTECVISREANVLPNETGQNTAFAGRIGDGYAVDLPFDPAGLMFDARSSVRLFPGTKERLPAEEVSHVAKGELRLLLHRVFELLHHARGVHYAHLWYFPGGKENLFAFRIDTDGGRQAEVEKLYDLALKQDLPFTWYLDVKSHERWLAVFRSMEGQEIGVHCYEHKTYDSLPENKENISTALRMMKSAGLDPHGYSAPYGHWNTGLAQAIDDLTFQYSSEFSYAYDTFPFYPESGGKRFSALQVPIHPVCIGSMRRVGYSEEEMKEYFHQTVEWKLCRNEPLFFYHHPRDGCPDVVEDLFNCVHEREIHATTLGDFAQWWKKRGATDVSIESHGDEIAFRSIDQNRANESLWMEITTGDGVACRVPLSARSASRSQGEWRKICRKSPPNGVSRTRDFDMRTHIGYWYNNLLRKLR